MRAVCGSELSYTASFTYRALCRPFAAPRKERRLTGSLNPNGK
jgi:hypothetical protein